MDRDQVLAAFRAEAGQLATVMLDVSPQDWARPSPCPPWSAAELLGHVVTVITWIPGMLSTPAPTRAEVSAVDYYRPDERYSAQTNGERIELAQQRAANAPGRALAVEFDRSWRHILELCRREPHDRIVRTRHGDAMLLTDFLVTRIVELGIHGLDLATALGREPWLTRPASQMLIDLILGDHASQTMRDLGWNDITALRAVTGRRPLSAAETSYVRENGVRWLALG